MIAERTVEIQLAHLPYKRFSSLGPGEGMDSEEADEVVFNLERKSTRIRSHFKGADTTLFKPFFCPTFGETLSFSKSKLALLRARTHVRSSARQREPTTDPRWQRC